MEHPEQHDQDAHNFTLTLDVIADNAPADGNATNVVEATLQENGSWAQGEKILFTVTGHASFTDSGGSTTTVVVPSQGVVTVSLTDTTEESVTVIATVISDPSVSRQVSTTFGVGEQILPPPELTEAKNGRINPDDVAGGDAHVYLRPWSGMRTGSTVTLFWVGTDSGGSASVPYMPDHIVTEGDKVNGVTFPVDADRHVVPFAGGRLEIAYMSEGATSERIVVAVEAVAAELDAPTVDEAVNGRIPADTDPLTLRIPAWRGMTAGDDVEYTWEGTAADGDVSILRDGRHLVASDIGNDVIFELDGELAVEPCVGGHAEAWYKVTASGGRGRTSAHGAWSIGDGSSSSLPGPALEEADGGYIDLTKVGDSFHILLKWSQMAENDRVDLYWKGTDAGGSAGNYQQVASHTVTRGEATSGQVCLKLDTGELLAPYEKGRVESFYSLNRASGDPTERSESSVWEVRPKQGDATEDFEQNVLRKIREGETIQLVKSGAMLNAAVGGMEIRGDGEGNIATEGNYLYMKADSARYTICYIEQLDDFRYARIGFRNRNGELVEGTIAFVNDSGKIYEEGIKEGEQFMSFQLSEPANKIRIFTFGEMCIDNITLSKEPIPD